jgi:hypothetical protein
MLAEAKTKPEIEVVGPPAEMEFDESGNLLDQAVEVQTTV